MNAETGKVKGEADVIFFDAAGTLIHLEQPAGWHYALIANKYGLEADAAQMEAAFRTAWKSRLPRPASAGPRPEDDRPWWRALALEVLHTAVPSASEIDGNAWFEDLYAHFAEPGVWVLYEDVARCLDRLARRHRLAVVSNFDQRLRRVLADLGIAGRFERIFISSEIGCEKPDPEIFRRVLDAINVEAVRCLHVGDDPENDWAGASAAGLAVFRVSRPQVTLDDLL